MVSVDGIFWAADVIDVSMNGGRRVYYEDQAV